MNKSGLIVKLAVVVLFTAVAVGTLVSQIFFRITYINELEAGKIKIAQLYNTISTTASIATYLEDKELVEEVLNGLSSNNIIYSVAVQTTRLNAESPEHRLSENSQTFALYSPFENDRQVGSLIITPDIEYISERARNISWDNLVAITIQATIITLAVVIVAYVVVTQPIVSIARKLHLIKPGTEDKIHLPRYHKHSEIGQLVADINDLLGKTRRQIIDERLLRQQVEKLSKHFKLLFENSNSPIVLSEPNGNIILYNKAFVNLLQRLDIPLQQNFGMYLRELFEEPMQIDHLVEETVNIGEFASGEFKLRYSPDNTPFWVHTVFNSTLTDDFHEYIQITLHDISIRRQQVEQLNQKAHTDKLTNLLNRRGGEKHISSLIQQQTPFALLLLDLNRFKPINDIYGHDVGDEMLKNVANQLIKSLRNSDMIARWGGDEFVIALPNVKEKEVADICLNVKNHVGKPLFLSDSNESVSVGVSIGVTFYPTEQDTLSKLIKAADKAMYSLKESRTDDKYLAFYRDLT